MTDRLAASRVSSSPDHVWVYGNDHSPWVQAVLLGLHEKGIAHTLVTVPPLSVFLNSGVLMPLAKFDDADWLLDSERILVALGFSAVKADERRALQFVFASGAMQRTNDPWEFWYRFADVRDGHPMLARRLWNQFWRAFSIFSFFALITMLRRTRPQRTPEQLTRELSLWQQRLASGVEFLGGGAPDTTDLQLFGLVQMCASIPGPSFAVLRQDPELGRLREWIGAMQRRFSDYTHLYTARHFEPNLPEVERAPTFERLLFWSGAASMWLAFPITLIAVVYFARRVRKERLQRV